MPRPSGKCQEGCSCVVDCNPDGMGGTDWLSDLLDSGVDLDTLQVSAQYASLLVSPSGTLEVPPTRHHKYATHAVTVPCSSTLDFCLLTRS